MARAVAGPQRSARAPRHVVQRRQRAPVRDAAADQPERVERAAARVLGQHEPGARMRRGQHAVELDEQDRQALAPAPQPGGALEALLARGRAHLLVHVGEHGPGRVAARREQPKRRVQARPVDVRVEVVQARRQAAAHLPVRRRMVAARQLASAVAQAEQRVELLDQLGGEVAPAQRPDVDRVARRRLRRDLEHRERDVEAAADVDEAVLVLDAHVAGGAQLADQAAL